MLISTIAAMLAVGAPSPIVAPKIVSASLFKNGYAVIVREAPLNKSGETLINVLPAGALGTVWFTGSPGVRLKEIVTTVVPGKAEALLTSLDEILQFNVGKEVSIALTPGDEIVGKAQRGKILSADGGLVMLENASSVLAIQKTWISSISSADKKLAWKKTNATSTRAIRVVSTGGNPAKLYQVSLERGIMWAPAYAVDITDAKTLKLVAKATILNDLGDLNGIEARLITGFPNVPYASSPDPFLSGINVDGFVSAIMSAGTPGRYRDAAGFAGQMMSQNALRSDFRGDFSEAFAPSAIPGEQLEDLFFYPQANVKLKQGDRGYYVLFAVESPYEHVYTWDLNDAPIDSPRSPGAAPLPPETPGDVWNCLKFRNVGKQPWTTAPATTFKKNELLGQDMMTYTSVGAETLLKITKALDIRAERSAEETSRERGAIKNKDNYPLYDLVTVKETLQMSNRKGESVKMRIKRDLTGEYVSGEGAPKVVKTAKGLREVNLRETLEWNPTIAAGKTLTLTYSYKVYVGARGD